MDRHAPRGLERGRPGREVELRQARSEDLSGAALAEIRRLLVSAFDGRFSDEDWLHTLGGVHVTAHAPELVAHAAIVVRALHVGAERLRAGYVEGVATARSRRRQGLGTAVMRRVGDVLQGGYDLGALSTSLHSFYEPLGWQRWQGPTFVQRAGELVRTADEDDGIMVLACPTTAGVDRTLPIRCEARPGDDW